MIMKPVQSIEQAFLFIFKMWFYKNNKETPIKEMTAPMISRAFTFSLKNMTAGGIMSMGTRDMIVEAIPVDVYCTASRENDTPRNKPKNAPIEMNNNVFRFFSE